MAPKRHRSQRAMSDRCLKIAIREKEFPEGDPEELLDKPRPLGLTTNRMFSAFETTTAVLPQETPGAVGFVAGDGKSKPVIMKKAPLQYFFIDQDSGTLVLAEPGEEKNITFFPIFLESEDGGTNVDLFNTALMAPIELPELRRNVGFSRSTICFKPSRVYLGDDGTRRLALFVSSSPDLRNFPVKRS